ncbi:MAG: type I restriction endonuclease subunit R, EcoR124 family [Thomasclavelia sp.]
MKLNRHFKRHWQHLRIQLQVTPEEISTYVYEREEVFAKMFQNFDRLFAQLKSFTRYDDSMLEEYGITEEEYDRLCRALLKCNGRD